MCARTPLAPETVLMAGTAGLVQLTLPGGEEVELWFLCSDETPSFGVNCTVEWLPAVLQIHFWSRELWVRNTASRKALVVL